MKLESLNFKETLNFLVDSGSRPNIIKESTVTPETFVDGNEILKLNRITTHHVTTLGLALIDILKCPVSFHLEDDFLIPQHGILGSNFFKQFQVNVNYQENQLKWNGIIIPFELKKE
ncbi:hypothetical protein P5V15_001143 [Pogonomyrmex californicus]